MEKSALLFEYIYQTAQDEMNDLSVETLCDIAGASRYWYYVWGRQVLTDNVGKRKTEQILE